jgi:hypothetical protein
MTETYPQKITFGAMLEMGVRDVLPLIRKSPQMRPKKPPESGSSILIR